jgi:hypothetical protein
MADIGDWGSETQGELDVSLFTQVMGFPSLTLLAPSHSRRRGEYGSSVPIRRIEAKQ